MAITISLFRMSFQVPVRMLQVALDRCSLCSLNNFVVQLYTNGLLILCYNVSHALLMLNNIFVTITASRIPSI